MTAEPEQPRTMDQPLPGREQKSLTGSLAMAMAAGAVGGVAEAAATQAISALRRPHDPLAPPSEPQSHVILPPGVGRDEK
jgi:hypothetical protein